MSTPAGHTGDEPGAQATEREPDDPRVATPPGPDVVSRQRWALWLTCTATVMLVLDVTIVNVALPAIQTGLHTALTDLEWVVDAYALTLAALLLISGSFADKLGRRRVFRAGIATFTLGSLLCSLAPSVGFLIAARALQGCGGAALFGTALAILGEEFRGRSRVRALGIWGACIGGGLAIGPLAGGLLTQYVDWRAIFYVNVPIGVAVLIASRRHLAESTDPNASSLDWRGALAFGLSLTLLVIALLEGQRRGWTDPVIIACFAGAAAIAAAFIAIERGRQGALVDLQLFRQPMFAGATVAVVAQGFAIGPVLFYLVRYLQDVTGLSPLQAGIRVFPLTLVAFAAALLAGRLPDRVPRAEGLGVSLMLLGGGFALLALVDATSGWWVMLPGLLVAGLGWGAINPLAADTALGAVPHAHSGMASGINNTARQVGIAIGLASLGTLFQHEVTATMMPVITKDHLPANIGSLAAQGGVQQALAVTTPAQRTVASAALTQASTAGFHAVVIASGAVAFGVGVAVLMLKSASR